MRVTGKPPDVKQMLPHYLAGGRHRELVRLAGGPAPDGKYLHWDQLRYREPPHGITREEWWLGIKVARAPLYRYIPLRARDEGEFVVALLPSIEAVLRRIDGEALGEDAVRRRGLSEDQRLDALMDEAIHSAQIDGAAIGREAARDLLLSGRLPESRHERIVADTWEGVLTAAELAAEPLTPELFNDLHRAMTRRTLEHGEAGRLRQPHEDALVYTLRGEPLFDPPIADELPERLPALCAFANGESPDWAVHPVLRAVLLHLWVGYEHPFVDANGRIARALTLWGLISQGYPLFQYMPMSRIFRRERSAYERAFLFATSDAYDATYFVIHALDTIEEALDALASGVQAAPPPDPGMTPLPAPDRLTPPPAPRGPASGVTLMPEEGPKQVTLLPDEAIEIVDEPRGPRATLLPEEGFRHVTLLPDEKHPQATLLEHVLSVGGSLNERQLSLVQRALRHPDEIHTIRTHQKRYGVAYGTARADLQDLFARGFVVRRRAGRTWEFRPVREAVDRLFG